MPWKWSRLIKARENDTCRILLRGAAVIFCFLIFGAGGFFARAEEGEIGGSSGEAVEGGERLRDEPVFEPVLPHVSPPPTEEQSVVSPSSSGFGVVAKGAGLQLNDRGCTSQFGSEHFRGAGLGWTDWAGDANGFDFDCGRFLFSAAVASAPQSAPQDFRACIQLDDAGFTQLGSEQCTPWASENGGWSGWATDSNAYDPDWARVKIDTRPLPLTLQIDDARIGIQASDRACSAQFGSVQFTPWASENGGWSGWATDSNAYDPDCSRINLEVRISTPPPISGQLSGQPEPPTQPTPQQTPPPAPDEGLPAGSAPPSLPTEVLQYNASCAGLTAPDAVFTSQRFRARITMQNTGTAPWWGPDFVASAAEFLNDVFGRANSWGVERADLAASPVLPEDRAAFDFDATAPATPGNYSFSYQMSHEQGGAFGQWCSKGIEVIDAFSPDSAGASIPEGVVPPSSPTAPALICSVSPSAPTNNDTITWSVNVSGGQAPFRYQWSGTDGLSGTSQSVQKKYVVIGTKQGSVGVSAANGEIQSCSQSVFVWPPSGIIAEPYCDGATSKARISWRIETEGGSGDQGFYTDIDNDADWGNGFWNRFTPAGFNAASAPDGFSAFGGSGGSLILSGGTSYAARVYYVAGRDHTPTSSFVAASCTGTETQLPGTLPPPGTTPPGGIAPPSPPLETPPPGQTPPGSSDSGGGGRTGGGFPFDSPPAPPGTPSLPPGGIPSGTTPPVFVAPPPSPPPAPLVSILNFSATPPAIRLGETARLDWLSENAVSCRIDQSVGSVPVNGSQPAAPRDTTTYTLTCTDMLGLRDQKQATVTLRKPGSATFQEVPPK